MIGRKQPRRKDTKRAGTFRKRNEIRATARRKERSS